MSKRDLFSELTTALDDAKAIHKENLRYVLIHYYFVISSHNIVNIRHISVVTLES